MRVGWGTTTPGGHTALSNLTLTTCVGPRGCLRRKFAAVAAETLL